MPIPNNVQKLVDPTPDSYAVCNCPNCGAFTVMDEDQYHGRVSMLCDCGYHETHDMAQLEKRKTDAD